MKVFWFGAGGSVVYGGALVCANSIEEARDVLYREDKDASYYLDDGEEMPTLQTIETEPIVLIDEWDCC